jgi:hypothetical protein
VRCSRLTCYAPVQNLAAASVLHLVLTGATMKVLDLRGWEGTTCTDLRNISTDTLESHHSCHHSCENGTYMHRVTELPFLSASGFVLHKSSF